MSKTVLVFSNSISGLFAFRREVMAAIANNGYEVFLVGPEDDESIKSYTDIGCKVVSIQFSSRGTNPLADISLLKQYVSLIKSFKPVVVLTYTIKPNIYGGMACRLLKVPQIANITGLGDALENEGWLQKLTIFLYRLGLTKARKVFFQNQYNRDFCIKHKIVRDNTGLLPGSGVNLGYHQLQPYPEEGNAKMMFIGRLIKDKGAQEYLNTAEVITTKYPGTEFWILGGYSDEYQSQVTDLIDRGCLKYFKATKDIRPYLKDVHCTIMPSYHEGMSNVNLESAANGRPVITTDVPGCRETVDDGRTGYLCEAKSAKSLTAVVEKFIALPYEQKQSMGENGREKVEKEFDRQLVVDAYLKEIESIAHV